MSSTRIRRRSQGIPVCSGELVSGGPTSRNAFLGSALGSEPMDKTREPVGHLSSIVGICLLLIGLVVFGVVQQKAWSHQAELTSSFRHAWRAHPSNSL